MMVNLMPDDIPNVDDMIDVAAYYTSFAPYEDPRDAFRYTRASDLLDAAAAHDLQVALTLPVVAHPDATALTTCSARSKAPTRR